MTVHAQVLTNPGAETGTTAGWTGFGDALNVSTAPNGIAPHSGSWSFFHNDGAAETTGQRQDKAVDVSLHAAIDAGAAAVRVSGWYNTASDDPAGLTLEFFDGGMVSLGTGATGRVASSPINTWAKHEIYASIPANTRTIRIGTDNRTNGLASRVRWDDFEMDISDDSDLDWPEQMAPKANQIAAYAYASAETSSGEHEVLAQQLAGIAWVTHPAQDVKEHQGGVLAFVQSETSSGLFQVKAHQLAAYAWVKGFPDRRDLRAWHFVQDDHPFTVFQLGDTLTIVHDRLTQQWAQWRSSGYTYWRGDDGCAWEGFNICCDRRSGRIFKIDPTSRLDFNDATEANDTPIVSAVTGMARGNRMRGLVSCYMAELVVSESDPPSGFDDGSVGIRLRTSDDDGRTWLDHGTIPGEGVGEDMVVRWYGLGLMQCPGRIFEITDTGYARRIDALDAEVKNG